MPENLTQPLLESSTSAFLRKASSCTLPVLLLGETGTGKSFLAKITHQRSARARGPCVEIGCGTIARDLMERELFGHERGAFTGADRTMPGVVTQADGGTLILNELEAIEPSLQPKILDLADNGTIRGVGSTQVQTVDARLVFTTNCDLVEALQTGRLREDLYYRIRMLMHVLPPLRKRRGDIPALARVILWKEWHLVRESKGDAQPPELSPEANEVLREHDWPGNMRELKAVVLGAALDCREETIGEAEMRSSVKEATAGWAGRAWRSQASAAGVRYEAPQDPEEERRRISRALAVSKGNRTHAARELGMSRTTLWERIRRHGLLDTSSGPGDLGPDPPRSP